MDTAWQTLAAFLGLFLGTLLFSRVGAWIAGILEALGPPSDDKTVDRKARPATVLFAAVLHSGPWLLAAVAYWAYHVLRLPHSPAWVWFFGGVLAAIPVWIAVMIFLHVRGKRIGAKDAKAKHAV